MEDVDEEQAKTEADLKEFRANIEELLESEDADYALFLLETELEQISGWSVGPWQAEVMRLMVATYAAVHPSDSASLSSYAVRAIDSLREVGDEEGEYEVMQVQAKALLACNCFEEAIEASRRSVARCRELGKSEVWALQASSKALLMDARTEEAMQAAEEAVAKSREASDRTAESIATSYLAEAQLEHGDVDLARATASEARQLASNARDDEALALAYTRLAGVEMADAKLIEALRHAEKAVQLWRRLKDPIREVDVLLIEAAAKLDVCQSRGPHTCNNTGLAVLAGTKQVLKQALRCRPQDHACIGRAKLLNARTLMQFSSYREAEQMLKEAAGAFKKARQMRSEAQARLLLSEASMDCGFLQDARAECKRAVDLCQQVDHTKGLELADALNARIDKALGLPTAEELRQQAALADAQTDFIQPELTGGVAQEMQQSSAQPQNSALAGLGKSAITGPISRDLILSKLAETVAAILGDDEPIEEDVPLMEAGITSNTAVILRNSLMEQIPGVSLPPTLIFDYPSMSEISGFIVDQVAH
mmetsp:Transcript_73941/g.161865  ORF Transcript_73941/g.161865 Transcript_73941/m.161865 type:complete len:538 (-) Transcript_73941:23-1636(-)